jgi:hypothetical protein
MRVSFRARGAQFEKCGILKFGFAISPKSLLETPYEAAYRTARQNWRDFNKARCTENGRAGCGLEQKGRKWKRFSYHITRYVLCNILKHVIEELTASPFPLSMQMDEGISQCSQLLVFVRYLYADANSDEFLSCEFFSETTKAVDVFEMVKSFLPNKTLIGKKKNFILFCTDEARAMLGNTSSVAASVKTEVPHFVVTHRFLYRPAMEIETFQA